MLQLINMESSNQTKVNILITGINGFVGEHLAKQIKASGYSVFGVGRETAPAPNVSSFIDQYLSCDLMKAEETEKIDLSNTAAIIHLAGLASVRDSFNNPELYINSNANITGNILSTAEKQKMLGRIVVVSTGALYDPSQPMPLTETSSVAESSPYAIGKMKAEKVAKDYIKSGLNVVIARPFNHVGAHQRTGFLVPDLYEQLRDAANRGEDKILVGNLDTRRDYTDVRDIAKAYIKLIEAETLHHDTYNICSGESISGLEVLNAIKDSMGLSDISTVIDPSRVRPTDAPDVVGSPSRIREDTGWEPESTALTAIKDFVTEQ